MNVTTTLSSKFQVVIPKAARSAMNLEAVFTVAFIPKGTGVLPAPVPKRETLQGMAKGALPVNYRDRSDRTP